MRRTAGLLVLVLAAMSGSPLAATSSASCCPMGGDMSCCPAAATGSGECAVRSCPAGSQDRVLVGSGVLGVLPQPSPSMGLTFEGMIQLASQAKASPLSVGPDSPPPRG